jgi:hypothetical protein
MMFVIRSYLIFHSSSCPLKCKNFFGKRGNQSIYFYLGAFEHRGEGQNQEGEGREGCVALRRAQETKQWIRG